SRDVPWKGGPGQFGKSVISPQATTIIQSMESHIEAYAPGAYGQKHGHLNSAVFYVLKGRGHDVHDGRHIPWKAGDVMIVENGCVHQHFNDDPENEAILLVFKAKPLFLFMHLLFEKIVEWPPDKPPPGARASTGTCGRRSSAWSKDPATTCIGTCGSTDSMPSSGSGRRCRRSSSGKRATTSTSHRSPRISTSRPRRRGSS